MKFLNVKPAGLLKMLWIYVHDIFGSVGLWARDNGLHFAMLD